MDYKKLKNEVIEDVDSPQYTKESAAKWTESQATVHRPASRVWIRALLAVVFSVVFAGILVLVLHIFMITVLSDNQGLTKFLGHSGMNQQTTTDSFEDSSDWTDDEEGESEIEFVTEHYVSSPTEQLWVVKDRLANVEILKSQTADGAVCYVSFLTEKYRKRETRELKDDVDSTKSKDYRSMVFETLDSPPRENVDIGGRGTELCSGVPIVWLNPVPENHKYDDVDDDDDLYIDAKSNLNMTTAMSGWTASSNKEVGRSKRNIRQCRTSCCWLVCCCNVHHFTWETVEEFTCVHICNGCTKLYKSKIEHLC